VIWTQSSYAVSVEVAIAGVATSISVSSIDTATATYNNFLILLFSLLGLYFYSFIRAIVPVETDNLDLYRNAACLGFSICKRSGISNLVIIPTTRELGVEVIAIEAFMVPVNTESPVLKHYALVNLKYHT
jgi:hypothetical protein